MLFQDVEFLNSFSNDLASHVDSYAGGEMWEHLDDEGLPPGGDIPEWAMRAVYYRDSLRIAGMPSFDSVPSTAYRQFVEREDYGVADVTNLHISL